MLNILIVDDEAPAHDVLAHHCRAHEGIRIVGHCHNAAQALTALQTLPVDLMFLDIRMPGFGGLDLLRGLEAPPLTVIASAHREHALDGFDLDVVDYLLKPVSAERFGAALDKVRRRFASIGDSTMDEPEDLVLKVDRSVRRFRFDSISHFEAQGNFVKVWTGRESAALATTTLRHLRETLPSDRFIQVHKSFIVNRSHVVEQRINSLSMSIGTNVPIGRRFRGFGRLLP